MCLNQWSSCLLLRYCKVVQLTCQLQTFIFKVIKLLKSKEASNVVDIKSWPPTLDTDELPKKKLPGVYRAPTAELVAYLDFSVSTTGMLAGIKMSHSR